jgi:hypothetical protein
MLEVNQAASLIEDLRRQKAAGVDVEIVTHTAPDADAFLSAALVKSVLDEDGPGAATVVWMSSNVAVGEEHAQRMGVDVKTGPRSIKGRETSAAEVIASAIKLIGWELDGPVAAIVDEVTLIDTGQRREAALDMNLIICSLRSAGWSDDEILLHVISQLSSHMSPPPTEALLGVSA